jgi:peptidoglycan/LPS O-acetylase OafA/YrhL
MQWDILAALRFFLAWIVACSHLQHFTAQGDPLVSFKNFSGFAAVLGFLSISGYSIAHSLHRNPQGFYQRRFIRIYPLYFCSIFISLIPFLYSGSKIVSLDSTEYVAPTVWNVLGNLVFLQNLIFNPLPSNGVVWTLNVEVLCYVLAPWLLKLRPKQIISLFLFSAVCFILYYLWGSPWGKDIAFLRYGMPLILLLWAWLLGFFCFGNQYSIITKTMGIALGCLTIGISSYSNPKLGMMTFLGSLIIILWATKIAIPKPIAKVWRYLGEISYPLYLFHSFAFLFGYSVLGMKNSMILMSFALLISMIFYHLIDVPCRDRDRRNKFLKLLKSKFSKFQ